MKVRVRTLSYLSQLAFKVDYHREVEVIRKLIFHSFSFVFFFSYIYGKKFIVLVDLYI